MTPVECRGLDGSNPLGFLAALGALRVLDIRARGAGAALPRLSWVDRGRWTAAFNGPESIEEITKSVLADAVTWADDPILTFAYSKGGNRLPPGEKDAVRDLKPPPTVARQWLEEISAGAASGDRRDAKPQVLGGS